MQCYIKHNFPLSTSAHCSHQQYRSEMFIDSEILWILWECRSMTSKVSVKKLEARHCMKIDCLTNAMQSQKHHEKIRTTTGSLCQHHPPPPPPHWQKKKCKNAYSARVSFVTWLRHWPTYAANSLNGYLLQDVHDLHINIDCRLHQYLSSSFPKYGTLYYTNICQLLRSSPSLFACSRSWNQHQHMWLEQLAWVW